MPPRKRTLAVVAEPEAVQEPAPAEVIEAPPAMRQLRTPHAGEDVLLCMGDATLVGSPVTPVLMKVTSMRVVQHKENQVSLFVNGWVYPDPSAQAPTRAGTPTTIGQLVSVGQRFIPIPAIDIPYDPRARANTWCYMEDFSAAQQSAASAVVEH